CARVSFSGTWVRYYFDYW
nr:immunoglobulin heavy chain junction region [Macaca mulatta]MOV50038.1 immunoglobulin heavy chain junction region [Macaca mulatta]MOV50577.1 immunoglobulin heavy chain junction region [Macaca mulatta]MOV51266.1 immunoglobulin heavy chain junction region [Macaca mulatta]MOV51552.1 immunoglobulin heavy chain junction region [Macaca mulatta]